VWLLALVAIKTSFTLRQPAIQVAKEVARWFLLGLAGPNVNAYPNTGILMAAVAWTLRYEWFFYGSLILTAFWVRRRPGHLVFTAISLAAVSLYVLLRVHASKTAPPSVCAELFLVGMMCASLKLIPSGRQLPNWLSSTLVVLCTSAVFLGFNNANMLVPVLLLGIAFFLVISGCNVFGLLVSRPARRLGDVSYGIYLLHGLILTCIFSFPSLRAFALHSAPNYWLVVMSTAFVVIVVATVAHVFIERPGIELGRRVATTLETRLGSFKQKDQPLTPAKAFTAHQ
jgi:peptidoglycan/LPS O-acetylase OafA/YrhL